MRGMKNETQKTFTRQEPKAIHKARSENAQEKPSQQSDERRHTVIAYRISKYGCAKQYCFYSIQELFEYFGKKCYSGEYIHYYEFDPVTRKLITEYCYQTITQ